MKVGELIQRLSVFDPERTVVVGPEYKAEYFEVVDIVDAKNNTTDVDWVCLDWGSQLDPFANTPIVFDDEGDTEP